MNKHVASAFTEVTRSKMTNSKTSIGCWDRDRHQTETPKGMFRHPPWADVQKTIDLTHLGPNLGAKACRSEPSVDPKGWRIVTTNKYK